MARGLKLFGCVGEFFAPGCKGQCDPVVFGGGHPPKVVECSLAAAESEAAHAAACEFVEDVCFRCHAYTYHTDTPHTSTIF